MRPSRPSVQCAMLFVCCAFAAAALTSCASPGPVAPQSSAPASPFVGRWVSTNVTSAAQHDFDKVTMDIRSDGTCEAKFEYMLGFWKSRGTWTLQKNQLVLDFPSPSSHRHDLRFTGTAVSSSLALNDVNYTVLLTK